MNFCTAIDYSQLPQTPKMRFKHAVESYFFLGARKVTALADAGGIKYVQNEAKRAPVILTCIKIASFFILILPLILLIAKAILRAQERPAISIPQTASSTESKEAFELQLIEQYIKNQEYQAADERLNAILENSKTTDAFKAKLAHLFFDSKCFLKGYLINESISSNEIKEPFYIKYANFYLDLQLHHAEVLYSISQIVLDTPSQELLRAKLFKLYLKHGNTALAILQIDQIKQDMTIKKSCLGELDVHLILQVKSFLLTGNPVKALSEITFVSDFDTKENLKTDVATWYFNHNQFYDALHVVDQIEDKVTKNNLLGDVIREKIPLNLTNEIIILINRIEDDVQLMNGFRARLNVARAKY